MTDPAVEAALRATAKSIPPHTGVLYPGSLAAAREALNPIRALHRLDKELSCADGCCDTCECGHQWPCDTARLIYTSEELTDELEKKQ